MSKKAFTYWWYNIGSGMTPRKDEDQERHASRVAEAAWDAATENSAAPDLLDALKSLTTNPHVNLGDLVYKVRDSEGEGWDGPQVKAWSDAVQSATAAIAKAEGRAE